MSRWVRALQPGEQECHRPDHGDGELHGRGQSEEHVRTGDQIDAGRHHGCRVDQGTHRGGTGHGVGQPRLQG